MHVFSVMGKLLLEVGINIPLFVCIIKSGEVLHSGIPQHWLCNLNLWVRFLLLLYSFSAWLNESTEQKDMIFTVQDCRETLFCLFARQQGQHTENQKETRRLSHSPASLSCFSLTEAIWKLSGLPHLQHTWTGAWEKQKARQDAQVKKLFSQGCIIKG